MKTEKKKDKGKSEDSEAYDKKILVNIFYLYIYIFSLYYLKSYKEFINRFIKTQH